jgi:hypothetical protein
LVALAALLATACNSTRSVIPEEFVPVASTPAGAVERLAWGFNNHSLDIVRALLSDDFVFQTAVLDSAGNTTSGGASSRDSLIAMLRSVLEGGPGVPRPASVRLSLDRNLVAFDDTRSGKAGKWHKTIRTTVDLVVVDSTTLRPFEATGHALFFLVRGDSASIPPEELAHGFGPDSTRWWIERWEDETIGVFGGARATAAPSAAALVRCLPIEK